MVAKKKTVRHRGKLAELIKLKESYTRSRDGTKIFYRSVGSSEGKGIPILCLNGLGVSTFFWKYIENHFKHKFQIITWDYRGHGLSELPDKMKPLSVSSLVEDCDAVFKALKLKKAILIGHSMGTQVMLEFYEKFPKRVTAMISCLGTYGKPLESFYNSPISKYIFDFVSLMGMLFPKQGQSITKFLVNNPFWFELGGLFKMLNPSMAKKKKMREYVDHIVNLDQEFFYKLARAVGEHSAEHVLKSVDVPTLIIAGEDDYFTPAWVSKKMHRLVKNSEILVINKGSHAAIIEQPDLINLRLEKFLNERVK